MYADSLRTGQNYDRLRKCISIGILDFKLTEESRYHRKYTLRGEDGAVYPDLFEIHTIELGKPLSGDDVIDDWIRLFNAEDEEDLAMIKRKSLGIAEVIAALRELSLGRRLRYYFEMRQKARRDRWAEDEYVGNCHWKGGSKSRRYFGAAGGQGSSLGRVADKDSESKGSGHPKRLAQAGGPEPDGGRI